MDGNYNNLKSRLSSYFYYIYFRSILFLIPKKEKYVFVDIDNTVTAYGGRFLKYSDGKHCDYKKANSFFELIGETPLNGSYRYIKSLSKKKKIIWFTARSIKYLVATYIWLYRNGFPIRLIVFTGQTIRKVEFLKLFLCSREVEFIIDDMREGYEFMNPKFVDDYKKYIEDNNIPYSNKIPVDKILKRTK